MGHQRAQCIALLSRVRHLGRNTVLHWTLALLFVAQALIPIQSHTRWAVDGNGHAIEICTLHGTVSIDPANDGPVAGQQDDRTAAMAFSLLLTGALAGHTELQPAWLALLSVPTPPAVIGMPTQRPLRFAHIRAPPSLV